MGWAINVSLKQTDTCYLEFLGKKTPIIIQLLFCILKFLEFVSSHNIELTQWIEPYLFNDWFSSSVEVLKSYTAFLTTGSWDFLALTM